MLSERVVHKWVVNGQEGRDSQSETLEMYSATLEYLHEKELSIHN